MSKNEVVAYDFTQDAGLGLEGLASGELMLPLLDVLQGNSGEISSGAEGARPGHL